MLCNRDLKHSLSREGFSKPLLLIEDTILLIYARSWNIHEDYTSKIFLIASILKAIASKCFRPKTCPSSAQNKRSEQDVMQSKAERDFARATLTLHASEKLPIYHWDRGERDLAAGQGQWAAQNNILLLTPHSFAFGMRTWVSKGQT